MKQTINFNQFVDAFRSMGRENQFTYYGKKALFEHIEQLEDETGEETELDIIALCCEYTEYEDLEEFQADYDDTYRTLGDIRDNTTVIELDNGNGFIIKQF